MAGSECHRFPFTITKLEENSMSTNSMFGGCKYVQVGPKKYLLSDRYLETHNTYYNFPVRRDDVWLLGFMKSGTTMTQEILYLIGTDLDYEKASKKVLDDRFPVIERDSCINVTRLKESPDKYPENVRDIAKIYYRAPIEMLAEMKERRFIKSHLPPSLVSPNVFSSGCKVVYCARNPKDVIVSNYHIWQLFTLDQIIEFKDFWNAFKNNLTFCTPFFEHVKEGWARRNDPNFLFIFYEDIIKNKRDVSKKIADFLGKKLTDEDLNKLEKHLKIENFRKNKSVNNDHLIDMGLSRDDKKHQFIRKGKVGGWRNYFTPELNAEADRWIEENLKGSDLVFPQ